MIANQPSDTFFAWPDDAVAELKRLDERGDSSSQIANALSAKFQRDITRNAVIGKRMRLGLQRSDAWRKANMQAVSERESARRDKETQRIRRVTEREAARLAKLARLQADHKPNSKENNVILLSTRIHLTPSRRLRRS